MHTYVHNDNAMTRSNVKTVLQECHILSTWNRTLSLTSRNTIFIFTFIFKVNVSALYRSDVEPLTSQPEQSG